MTYVNGYEGFLSRKEPHVAPSGLTTIPPLPSCLKPFQKIIVRWALRQGRCALFESTGLGKTLQQLVWADVVARHTKGRVLLFTPLAVAQQTVAEAEKFNIQGVAYAPDFAKANTRIVVTNYDRLHNFPLDKFAGVVLDESSILKAESGKTKDALIDGCQSIPWRLACTATPAPNDYKEFGNHSEFLGVMDQKEMLAMYFVHDGAIRAAGELEWRLKGHAKDVFWQWVASWSVILRSPSDLGLDGTEYELPPLQKHSIVVNTDLPIQDGYFFAPEKLQLSERIHARSETVEPRCRAAFDLICNFYSIGNRGSVAECGSQNTTSGEWLDTTKTRNIVPSEWQKVIQTNGVLTCGTTIKKINISGKRKLEPKRTLSTPLAVPNMQNSLSLDNARRLNRPLSIKHVGEIVPSVRIMESVPINTINNSKISLDVVRSAVVVPEKSVAAGAFLLTTATKQGRSVDCSAMIATSPSGILPTTSTVLKGQSSTLWKGDDQWIIWCGLNREQNALAKAFGDLCFSIDGALDKDEKVDRMARWLRRERPILISKVSIFGFGMNLQQCNKMVFVGLNDSFEQLYQAIRRCWRFGQTKPVNVWIVSSDYEGAVVRNVAAKEKRFEIMYENAAKHAQRWVIQNLRMTSLNEAVPYAPKEEMEHPQWL